MKRIHKLIILAVLVMFSITLTAEISFSQDADLGQQVGDERIELQERLHKLQAKLNSETNAESKQGYSLFETEIKKTVELKNLLDNFIYSSELAGLQTDTKDAYYFSTDPNDLNPILGTKWYFEYTILSKFDETINFGKTVGYNSDGSVYLNCTGDYNNIGLAKFVYNVPSNSYFSGNAFSVVIEGSILYMFYTFQISGNTASGFYQHKVMSSGSYSNMYALTGTKLSGPQPPGKLEGWLYMQWPYVYCANQSTWYYLFPEAGYLWYLNLTTNEWSKLP